MSIRKASIIILIFSILAIVKLYPDLARWEFPLSPDGEMHHHSIIKILYTANKNPDFLKGDLLTKSIKENYYVFYRYILEFFTSKLGISLNLFIHISVIISIILTVSGAFFLSFVLFRDWSAAVITLTMIIVIESPIFIGDSIINYPRCLSQGICLLSMGFFIREDYKRALALCGIASAFHYGMPFYCILFYSFFSIISIKRIGLRNISVSYLLFSFLFVLFNSHMLMNLLNPAQLNFDFSAWKLIVKKTGYFWSYIRLNPISILLGFLPIAAITFLLYRNYSNEENIPVHNFILIIISFFFTQVLHFLIFDVAFIPFLARAVIYNAQYYIPYFIVILLPPIVLRELRKKISENRPGNYIPLDALLIIVLFLALNWIGPSVFANNRRPGIFQALIIAICILELFVLNGRLENYINTKIKLNSNLFGGNFAWSKLKRITVIITLVIFAFFFIKNSLLKVDYTDGSLDRFKKDDWYRIQVWSNENTKAEDVFVLPNEFGRFGFRIYAERSTLCSNIYEAHLVALLSPGLTDRIVENIKSFWSTKVDGRFNGIFSSINNLIEFHESRFRNLSEDDFIGIQHKYPKFKYLITKDTVYKKFRLLYKSGPYRIYSVMY